MSYFAKPFRPKLVEISNALDFSQIKSGIKTQITRVKKIDEFGSAPEIVMLRCENRHVPILVESVDRTMLGEYDEEDAFREGFDSLKGFRRGYASHSDSRTFPSMLRVYRHKIHLFDVDCCDECSESVLKIIDRLYPRRVR